jgi:WD40 repeat protein
VAVVSSLNRDEQPIWPRLRKWNVESHEVLWEVRVGTRGPLVVAPNERWFAHADWDEVVIYSTRSGEVLGVLSLELPKRRISRLSLSPNNRRLALGTSDGQVIVYDLGDFSLEAP